VQLLHRSFAGLLQAQRVGALSWREFLQAFDLRGKELLGGSRHPHLLGKKFATDVAPFMGIVTMKHNTDLALALRALAKQGWFSQRSLHTRARLSSIAKLRTFAKDELVYLAGDPPSGVFGLVTGSLNISYPRADGEDYNVHRAGSGFWIGDVALFAKGGRLVS